MNRCVRNLLPLAIAFGASLAVARADSDVVAKSPFMSPSAVNAAAPTAGAPLEYRGMMETSAGTKVRIVDPSKKGGAWLLVNERDPAFDFVVKKIDIEHETVTLDYQGRPLTLAQHVAKVASAGVAPNMPMVQNGPPMPAAITNSVVVNPTPADEQRRLDAVAAEVARRRALREQASQQVGQGVPIAPQIIQQQQEQRQQMQQQQQQNLQQQQQNNAAQRGAALRGQRGRGVP